MHGGGDVDVIDPAYAGLQRRHERVRGLDRMELGPVATHQVDPRSRDGERLGVQGSMQLGGDARCEVAPIG